MRSGIIECAMSDHYMIYTILKPTGWKSQCKQGVRYVKDFNSFDAVHFNNDLMDLNLCNTVGSVQILVMHGINGLLLYVW